MSENQKTTQEKQVAEFLGKIGEPKGQNYGEQQKAKRESFYADVQQKLERAISSPEELKDIISVAARFPDRKINNIIAIADKKKDAVFLQTRAQWKSDGAIVKGEGIDLLTKGKPYFHENKMRTGVDVIRQYDISETNVRQQKQESVKNQSKEALKALQGSIQCKIAFHDNIPVNSLYSPNDDTVYVSESAKSSTDKAFLAVVSGLSERGQCFENKSEYEYSPRVCFQAYCTAHIVAERYGVDTSKLIWNGDAPVKDPKELKETLKASFEQSNKLCERIERSIEKPTPAVEQEK